MIVPIYAKVSSEKWLRTIKNNKGANNRELKKWEEEPAKYYSEIFSLCVFCGMFWA
jgi:hypothetical protein